MAKKHVLSHLTLTAGPHMFERSLHLNQRMNADLGHVEQHHNDVTSKLFKHHNLLHGSHHKPHRR